MKIGEIIMDTLLLRNYKRSPFPRILEEGDRAGLGRARRWRDKSTDCSHLKWEICTAKWTVFSEEKKLPNEMTHIFALTLPCSLASFFFF